jgi:hypothetical protein
MIRFKGTWSFMWLNMNTPALKHATVKTVTEISFFIRLNLSTGQEAGLRFVFEGQTRGEGAEPSGYYS